MKKRTGYLFKRGGVYWLRYTVDGKRFAHSLKTTNKREAEAAAEKEMAPMRAADTVETLKAVQTRLADATTTAERLADEASPPLAIRRAWDQYLESETRPRSGPQTLNQYEGHFDAFARWLTAQHPEAANLRDISPDMAAGFVRHLEAERRLSGNRINKHVRFLRTFFRVMAKRARITANPFADIAPRRHLVQSKRPLTIEELRTAISAAKGELQTLFMLGTFTGLRLADAATLQWGEVDLARCIIRRIPRKTARTGKAVIIGLPAYLAGHLAALKRRGPFVLPDTAAEYEANPPALSQRIQGHLGKCGIDTVKPGTGYQTTSGPDGKPIVKHTGKRAVVLVGFHSLRHSFVSLHAQAGTPQAILQKLAGHSNPMMTEHYTHISEDSARTTAAAFPLLLAAAVDEAKAPELKREPLPAWAAAKIAIMTGRNWKALRAELMNGGAP
jgi:integrase